MIPPKDWENTKEAAETIAVLQHVSVEAGGRSGREEGGRARGWRREEEYRRAVTLTERLGEVRRSREVSESARCF